MSITIRDPYNHMASMETTNKLIHTDKLKHNDKLHTYCTTSEVVTLTSDSGGHDIISKVYKETERGLTDQGRGRLRVSCHPHCPARAAVSPTPLTAALWPQHAQHDAGLASPPPVGQTHWSYSWYISTAHLKLQKF